MIVIGLTGGIASGKTTILDFIEKQNIPVHDSDRFVYDLYNNPTKKFISYLKLIGLELAIKRKKINKEVIKEEIFNNNKKLKDLELFIHKQVKLSRNVFLKKNKHLKKALVVLDIPLLFEFNLENICDYVFLAYCPLEKRFARALNRKNMNKAILKKIIKLQVSDRIKKAKSDFIINTSTSKDSTYKQILQAIKKIKLESNNERSSS